jgi:hypothetical protein
VRRLVSLAGTLVCVVSLLPLCTGCSGTGAPAEPADLAELRAIAEDQVTTVLLVKRWFAILYPRPAASGATDGTSNCMSYWHRIRSEPGDPPGSSRWKAVMSDCTPVTALRFADSSGQQVFRYADGHQRTCEWSPLRLDGSWQKRDMVETLWDDTVLAYEIGLDGASPLYDSYERGQATLGDGRTMPFSHERNRERDAVELTADGARIAFEVPLAAQPGAGYYWPVFDTGGAGTYRSASGREMSFKVTGNDQADVWEGWTLATANGIGGSFALAGDLAGTGNLRRADSVVGSLSWDAEGHGVLRPVGAATIAAVPSAAARDFLIDQWIRNIAAMGPMPMY